MSFNCAKRCFTLRN